MNWFYLLVFKPCTRKKQQREDRKKELKWNWEINTINLKLKINQIFSQRNWFSHRLNRFQISILSNCIKWSWRNPIRYCKIDSIYSIIDEAHSNISIIRQRVERSRNFKFGKFSISCLSSRKNEIKIQIIRIQGTIYFP